MGRAVLGALAAETATDRPDVAATLAAVAREDHVVDDETARVVAAFASVRKLGPAERNAAARILDEFVAYASTRRGRR